MLLYSPWVEYYDSIIQSLNHDLFWQCYENINEDDENAFPGLFLQSEDGELFFADEEEEEEFYEELQNRYPDGMPDRIDQVSMV
jgi:hypothetical protein